MDFNENVHVEQRGRSEESRLDTLNGGEKIQQIENEDKSDPADNVQKGSKDSSKSRGFLKFLGNQPYQKAKQRGGNCKKMCEHDRQQKHEGNPDGNSGNSVGVNIGEQNAPDQRSNNYGKEYSVTGSDGNQSGTSHRNCKSGINISVVSRGEAESEDVDIEKPTYSVSFKCCYDNDISKCNSKRRKFPPTSRSNTKRFKLLEPNKNENVLSIQQVAGQGAGIQPNYRCTFENCCGNCESYIVEIPSNDCNAYKNWQSSDFDSGNACFEDCCCPREMRVYSSNLSVLPQGSCGGCVDGDNCCSSPQEGKCDFIIDDCHTPSKHYLQRVHFAKYDDRPKRDHSSCSFCSRKCTPSKASLFVEIGESVADVCNLTSIQPYQCAESMESLKDCGARTVYGTVKENGLDNLRGKSKKRSRPRCSPSCKGAPGSVARTRSDRIASADARLDDYSVDQEMRGPEVLRNARSHVSFQEVQDSGEQMESDMDINDSRPNCNQQCETDERSLWNDIRRGKIWEQLQDTYKSFVKVAATGIEQIVKQSSKLKRSKKSTKDRLTCGTSTEECEENLLCAEQFTQWGTCNDCLYEGTCWDEVMIHDSNNCDTHCCSNVCCDSIPGLPECRKSMCQNDCWQCKGNTQKLLSQANNHFDPSDNVQSNVQPTYMLPLKDPLCSKNNIVRKRGGADQSNQKKKPPNSNRRPNQNAAENAGHSDQRENNNTRNQISKRADKSSTICDQQLDRNTMHIDVCVQASGIRTIVDPPNAPVVTETLAYRKRIRTVRQVDTFPDENTQRGPVIQEVDSALHPARPATKKQSSAPKKNNAQSSATPKSGTTSAPLKLKDGKQGTSRASNSTPRQENNQRDRQITRPDRSNAKTPLPGKAVQCVILQDLRLVCAPAGSTEATDETDTLCVCKPTSATPQHVRTTGAARNGAAIPAAPEDPPAGITQVAETAGPAPARTPAIQPTSATPQHVGTTRAARNGAAIPAAPEDPPAGITQVVETAEPVPARTPASIREQREQRVGIFVPEETPTTQDVPEPSPIPSDSVVESSPESVVEPSPEGVIEPSPEGVIEPSPEGVIEPSPEGVSEPSPEGVTEPSPEGVIEPSPEGVTEPSPETDVVASTGSVIEPTEQPTIGSADAQAGTTPPANATSPRGPQIEYPEEVETEAIPLDSTTSDSGGLEVAAPATQPQQPVDYSLPDYYGSFDTQTTEYIMPESQREVRPESTVATAPAPQMDLVRPAEQQPIEISKIFNGNEARVTVEMQTSSIILTKILSEFQVGNKKRQLMMSIKVHTNADDNAAANGQQQPSASRDNTVRLGCLTCLASDVTNQRMKIAECSLIITLLRKQDCKLMGQSGHSNEIDRLMQGTARQPPQHNDSRRDQRRQTNQPVSHRSTNRRTAHGQMAPAYREEEPNLCDSYHNMCKGPCGRKKHQ